MLTVFVNKKSELTKHIETKGMIDHYRTRCTCGCLADKNIRNAVLFVIKNVIEFKAISCKACAARKENGNDSQL